MAWQPTYCSTAELAAFAKISDNADDVQLGLAISAASRAVDETCNRQFGSATATRTYTPRYDPYLCRTVVDIDDLMSTSGLMVAADTAGDGTYATSITTPVLRPINAAADGWPWTVLAVPSGQSAPLASDSIRITATWGWTAVPDAVKQATLLQATRIFKRRVSPFGVAGSPNEGGGELRLLAKVDPDVAVTLRPYTRCGWGWA